MRRYLYPAVVMMLGLAIGFASTHGPKQPKPKPNGGPIPICQPGVPGCPK